MGLKSGIQDSGAVIFHRKSAEFLETDYYLKKNIADFVTWGIFCRIIITSSLKKVVPVDRNSYVLYDWVRCVWYYPCTIYKQMGTVHKGIIGSMVPGKGHQEVLICVKIKKCLR